MSLFESLKQIVDEENKRKAKYIYLDEDNKIKERPLSKLDSSASALMNRTVNQYKNPAKIIHDFMFGF
jgi:hypothetical protein